MAFDIVSDVLIPEKEFQTAVMKKLRLIPKTWWQKLNDRVTSGLPDIVGSCAGLFVAIELKTKSKVTPIQAFTLRKIGQTGAYSFVVTPDNWAEVYSFMLELASTNNQAP